VTIQHEMKTTISKSISRNKRGARGKKDSNRVRDSQREREEKEMRERVQYISVTATGYLRQRLKVSYAASLGLQNKDLHVIYILTVCSFKH
jgi:hypothetical protein